MDDMIERLRNGPAPLADPDMNDEAADKIKRLRADAERIRPAANAAPRAWITREPDGNDGDGSFGGCREGAELGAERPDFGTEPLYDQSALAAAIAAERERLRAAIADDAWATEFQSLGQYRSALLRRLGEAHD